MHFEGDLFSCCIVDLLLTGETGRFPLSFCKGKVDVLRVGRLPLGEGSISVVIILLPSLPIGC